MRILRRLLGYLRPYLASLVVATLLLAASGALMGAVVSTIKPLVNDVLLGRASASASSGTPATAVERGPDILRQVRAWVPLSRISGWARAHAFAEVPLLLVTIFLIRGVLGYFGQYLTFRAGVSMIRDMRQELYRSIAGQSLGFFHRHPTGVLLSRILSDVSRLTQVVTVSLANAVRVGAMVPFVLAVAVLHEWRMSLLAIVALPLLGYPMVRLGRRLRRAATTSQEHMGEVSHKINESLGGIRVVQAFGMEDYETERVGAAIGRLRRAELRAGRANALGPAVLELFGAAVGAALFYVAGRGIAHRSLNPGDFAVVLFCLGLLFVSIRRLYVVYGEFQQALAAAERVFGLLDREPEIRDAPGAAALPRFQQELHFERVDFSYGDAPVLEGIELAIRRGEAVALVGASGSGKTTLANLLPRFHDPTAGRILIDGHDIREVTLASLRGQIGVVTQEPVLFDDTVRANIAYGRADCPLERIVEVARAAQAHEFIERLPRGYDTVLGERGTRLSMGQRQRITIARALLKDAPLLILDEATSALDAESEALVQRALEVLMRGRTSIVIAHRLATVRNVHRIVVLDQGCIAEQGSHAQLLAANGLYARLYELQFAERGDPQAALPDAARRAGGHSSS